MASAALLGAVLTALVDCAIVPLVFWARGSPEEVRRMRKARPAA